MGEIKPIETYYNGYRFRSRLEARWAVFFDALGLQYEYEPEGFVLQDGTYYLPDFLLHGVITRYAQWGSKQRRDIYVEVKGVPNAVDAQKIALFAENYPIWVVGNLPNPASYIEDCEKQRDDFCKKVCAKEYTFKNECVFCPYDYGAIDGDSCFAFSLAYDDGTLSFHGADSSYEYGRQDVEIQAALLKARQARFEHGETPTAPTKTNKVTKCPLHEYVLTCEGCKHEHNQQCDCGVEIGWNGNFVIGLYPDYQA